MADALEKGAALAIVGVGSLTSGLSIQQEWGAAAEKGAVAIIAVSLVAVLIRWFDRALDRWQSSTGDQITMLLKAIEKNEDSNTGVSTALDALAARIAALEQRRD